MLWVCLGSQTAFCYFGFSVSSIKVQGLKRIEKDAVLAKLGTKLDSTLDEKQLRADIQAIFNMGYFIDVDVEGEPLVEQKKINLTYRVRERPAITKLEFDGNERVPTSELRDIIKLKEWAILDLGKVQEDVALIQKHYEDKGFYLAKVTFEVKKTKEDEVELTYKIRDYEKVRIKKITFLNNKKFSDEKLKSVFVDTREGSIFSFINSSGNFKESAFKVDLQRLLVWYLEHGYIKFKYENPVVTISDDKKWLFISIYVDEGEQYRIGQQDFSGELLFPKDELHRDLMLQSNEVFSLSKRNADIQKLMEKYQDLGYAFVNVIPKMNIQDDGKKVDIEYEFEKGELVYFGEINILGNTKTHDKVLRRELKIHEGELYNGTKLRVSKENIERLGYFSPGEIVFNTVTPKGQNHILNLEITVKERSTGTISLGAGYGSYQGFFFTTQLSEINFLGRGQTVSLSAQYSIAVLSQNFNLGFQEPYTFDTLWSTGFDIYSIKFPIPYRYTTSRIGFDVRAGHPIAEYTRLYATYKIETIQDLSADPSVPQSVIQADTGLLSSVTWNVVRDKRNNRFEVTGGNYQSASLETAGIWGDMSFLKLVLDSRFYHRIAGDLVFRNKVEFGQISGVLGSQIPPAQKFYLGGPNNMKGYPMFLLGPQTVNPQGIIQPLGGNVEAFSLFELEYPLVREAGIKFVCFFDMGNTWDHWPSGAGGDPFVIRTDAGFGFRWFSPIGPLRFEWGFPLSQKSNEQSPVFNFFIGPPF